MKIRDRNLLKQSIDHALRHGVPKEQFAEYVIGYYLMLKGIGSYPPFSAEWSPSGEVERLLRKMGITVKPRRRK